MSSVKCDVTCAAWRVMWHVQRDVWRNLGRFPLVRAGRPERSVRVRKRNVSIWRISFIPVLRISVKLRVPFSECLFVFVFFTRFSGTISSKWRIRFTDCPVWPTSSDKRKSPLESLGICANGRKCSVYFLSFRFFIRNYQVVDVFV